MAKGETHWGEVTQTCGGSPVKSPSGKLYYISFTNDKTCYMRCTYWCTRVTLYTPLSFEAWIKTQHGIG